METLMMELKRKTLSGIILMVLIWGVVASNPLYGYNDWNGTCDGNESCDGGDSEPPPENAEMKKDQAECETEANKLAANVSGGEEVSGTEGGSTTSEESKTDAIANQGALGAAMAETNAQNQQTNMVQVANNNSAGLNNSVTPGDPVLATSGEYTFKEKPSIQEWYERQSGAGIELLTIAVGEEAETVREYLAEQGHTFPVVLNRSNSLREAYAERILKSYILDGAGGS
jgi:hypothetical protein